MNLLDVVREAFAPRSWTAAALETPFAAVLAGGTEASVFVITADQSRATSFGSGSLRSCSLGQDASDEAMADVADRRVGLPKGFSHGMERIHQRRPGPARSGGAKCCLSSNGSWSTHSLDRIDLTDLPA